MKIVQTLNSLENSWSREKVLDLIQNGVGSENIVNDFFYDNQEEIINLIRYIKPKDKELLKQIEELSNCEAKLINKINNYRENNDEFISHKITVKNSKLKNKFSLLKFSLIMNKWSNTLVVSALILISAIALTKQAWA